MTSHETTSSSNGNHMPSKTGFWNKKRYSWKRSDRYSRVCNQAALILKACGPNPHALRETLRLFDKERDTDGPSSSIAVLILSFALLSRPYGLFG